MMAVVGALGALGHWLLILAHARAPAPVLSPFIYTQIIWMIALGYLVFGDLPDRLTLVGAAIVIASGLYLLYRERVRGVSRNNPSP
jgi:drug/metabolite transporter (DMT)-like permease